jgi:hypothetical protein
MNEFLHPTRPEQRVGGHGLSLACVRDAAHGVDHHLAVPHHHDLHPDLGAAGHPPVDRRLDARLGTFTVSHVVCSALVDGHPTALRGWLSSNEGGPGAGRLLIVAGNRARMSTPDDSRVSQAGRPPICPVSVKLALSH